MTKSLRLSRKHFLLLLAIFAAHGILAQTIRYVNGSVSSGSNNGTSWADAYNDLQPAIAAAQPGDQIWVAKGIYYPTAIPTDQTSSFVMKNNVGIYGGFIGTETTLSQRDWKNNLTTLSGDIDHVTDTLVVTGSGRTLSISGNAGNSYHVINNGDGLNSTSILNGLSIFGGNANSPSNPNNYGGGMANPYTSSPSLVNCTFSGNNAAYGGSIYSSLAFPSLTNCFFIKNNAQYGGGVYKESTTAASPLVNCTFSGNNAIYGGAGVAISYSSLTLINCLFSENNAKYFGGGTYSNQSYLTFVNSTFSGNSALQGGGMYNQASSLTISSCILWNNSTGIYNEVGSSQTVGFSDLQGGYVSGVGNISQDPLFINSANPAGADGIFGTADDGLMIQASSPCFNRGTNAAIPAGITKDIAGLPRIMGGTVDMGAYESPYGSVLPLMLLNFSGNRQGSDNMLQWTTANEVGTKTFIVESSIDGNTFTAIGDLAAIGGGKYSFTDNNPYAIRTYYRLKMMDVDSKFTYSNIIWISTSATNIVSVYPNPVSQTTTLNIGDNANLIGSQVRLTDANGRVIKLFKIYHAQERLDMRFLPAGLYILKLIDGGMIKILKR